MAKTTSGCPICQPSANEGGAGRSARLPSGAPPLAHLTIVSRSASLRRRSFRNSPCAGSACHGGMVPFMTRVAIDFAHGRASLYVISAIGPISPARWQFAQFLYRMGATSLLNVGAAAGACAPMGADEAMAASTAPAATATISLFIVDLKEGAFNGTGPSR